MYNFIGNMDANDTLKYSILMNAIDFAKVVFETAYKTNEVGAIIIFSPLFSFDWLDLINLSEKNYSLL